MADTTLPKLFKAKETAEYLGVSEQALAHMRFRGVGPKPTIIGERSVRYREDDLLAYIDGSEERDSGGSGAPPAPANRPGRTAKMKRV